MPDRQERADGEGGRHGPAFRDETGARIGPSVGRSRDDDTGQARDVLGVAAADPEDLEVGHPIGAGEVEAEHRAGRDTDLVGVTADGGLARVADPPIEPVRPRGQDKRGIPVLILDRELREGRTRAPPKEPGIEIAERAGQPRDEVLGDVRNAGIDDRDCRRGHESGPPCRPDQCRTRRRCRR
jgi:hypothetical protein